MFSRVKISVIVPAFNEEKLLGPSLVEMKSAAQSFAKRGWEFELVVCNNNSTDRTAAIAEAAGAKVIFEPFNQIGRARNTGASAATGDWFVFVDADSHPSAALFADVAEQIASGNCMAGGATIRLDARHYVAGAVNWIWNQSSRVGKWLAGSFIFIQATAFREMGGFDTRFFAGEELELSQRIKKLARAKKLKVVVLHRHPLVTSARKLHLYTLGDHLKLLFRVFRNKRVLTKREECILWYDGRR